MAKYTVSCVEECNPREPVLHRSSSTTSEKLEFCISDVVRFHHDIRCGLIYVKLLIDAMSDGEEDQEWWVGYGEAMSNLFKAAWAVMNGWNQFDRQPIEEMAKDLVERNVLGDGPP